MARHVGLFLALVLLVTGCGVSVGGLSDLAVSAIGPVRGSVAGGVDVTVVGAGFYQLGAVGAGVPLSVTVCGAPLSDVAIVGGETRSTLLSDGSSTSVVVGGTLTGVTSSGGVAGVGDVVVTRPDGQSVSLVGAFDCYVPGPEITDFLASPDRAPAGVSIEFTWRAASPVGGALTCRLDPGDGSAPSEIADCHLPENQSWIHVYANTGAFTARLEVSSEDGDSASGVTTVMIGAAAPTASFTVSPEVGMAPLAVAFDASASVDVDGTIDSYGWDFGDGFTSTGVAASHSYASAGSFTVTLTVTDNDGATDSSTSTVMVHAIPVANADVFEVSMGGTLSATVTVDNGSGADDMGFPEATLVSFGGGSLGGGVADHAAGAMVPFAGGGMMLASDGGIELVNPSALGTFTIMYRLENAAGTTDGRVTVIVKTGPVARPDGFSLVLPGDLMGNVTVDNGNGPDNGGGTSATVASFGGGDLGGAVTDNGAGSSTALAGGTLTLMADGALTLSGATTPGVYEFSYRLTSSAGTDDATVTIDVQDAPEAQNDAFTMLVTGALDANVASDNGNGVDDLGTPAGSVVSFGGGDLGGVVTDNAAGSSVPMAGGTLTVDANGTLSLTSPTTSGMYSFAYRLENAAGSSQATVSIVVGALPTANDDTPANGVSYEVTPETQLTISGSGVLGNDVSGFPSAAVVSFGGGDLGGSVIDHAAGSTVTFGTAGSMIVSADGGFSLTPDTGFIGEFSFEYRVENTFGSSDATVIVNVNSTPVVSSLAISPNPGVVGQDVTVSWESTDANGDALSCSVDFGDGSANVVVNPCPTGPSSMSHTYSSAGSYTVDVTVSDGRGGSDSDSIGVEVAIFWTRQFGSGNTDYGTGVAVDAAGNVLVTGYSVVAPNGISDAFVRKFNAAGDVVWTRQFGTPDYDQAYGVAVDGAGNVLVAGYTSGSLDGTNLGNFDVFVRKFDASGSEVWTHQFGTNGVEEARGVAVDGAGNVLVVGYTSGSLVGTNVGYVDVFVRKLSPAGDVMWTRQFGGSGEDRGTGVAVDGAGNVWVTGYTSSSWEPSDVFVRKFSPAGVALATRQIGSGDREWAYAIAVDGAGSVLVTGCTTGSLDGVNAGGCDAFVLKFGASGNVVWTRQFGTSHSDSGGGVAVDVDGNVLVTGSTRGSLDGANAGESDVIVRKFSAAGDVLWARQFGTFAPEEGYGVAVDVDGNVVVTGRTRGSLEGVSAGFDDAFVRKYAP